MPKANSVNFYSWHLPAEEKQPQLCSASRRNTLQARPLVRERNRDLETRSQISRTNRKRLSGLKFYLIGKILRESKVLVSGNI